MRDWICSKSIKQCTGWHLFVRFGDCLHKISIFIFIIFINTMKTFSIIKGQITHWKVYANHWDQFKHLMGYQIKKRCSTFAPYMLQWNHAYLLCSEFIKKRKFVHRIIFIIILDIWIRGWVSLFFFITLILHLVLNKFFSFFKILRVIGLKFFLVK